VSSSSASSAAPTLPPPLHRWLSGAALLGILASNILGGDRSAGSWLFLVLFSLWAMAPWVALLLAGRFLQNAWITTGAALLGLAVEAGIRSSVFLFPRGSTAAIALVFSPALIFAAAFPAGAVLGWLAGRLWRWHPLGRIAVVLLAGIAPGLVWLKLARPELFPTTVLARNAALARIGPPRVAVGGDTFLRTPVPEARSAWTEADDLHPHPGTELVIASQTGARLMDPATLATLEQLDFPHLPSGTWNWFSRLVRIGDRYAIAQTGGGYSETKVLGLDGSLLWAYRPDPKLPPSSLVPADLDRDGQTEFYSTTTHSLVRLDQAGREIWSQPAGLAGITTLLPADGPHPAVILTVEHGRRAAVWDTQGKLLAEKPVPADDAPLALVNHPRGRVLIYGGASARGHALTGELLFEVPLPDMRLVSAHGVRLHPGDPGHLALVATADRDTNRSRALLVAADGRIAYDEITADLPRWLPVLQADGSHGLFLARPHLLERLNPVAPPSGIINSP
jgi:hypothetical protein